MTLARHPARDVTCHSIAILQPSRISHGIVRGPCRVLLSFSNCVSANGFTGARASACELDRGQFRTGRDIVALGRCRRSRACLNHSASFRREALFARENRTRPFLFRTRASFEGSATADCRSSHSKRASAGPGSGFYSGFHKTDWPKWNHTDFFKRTQSPRSAKACAGKISGIYA